MPVQYPAGTIEEHLRTRTHAGLFDVSHMGEIDVRGADAIALVNRMLKRRTKLIDGQAQYSALTTPAGTVVDDLLVYRFAADHLLLVVNAGTTEKDWDWIKSHRQARKRSAERTSARDYCQIALQGPDALDSSDA
jgi:aminomethyltransferase